jgi:hypothetical protein
METITNSRFLNQIILKWKVKNDRRNKQEYEQ